MKKCWMIFILLLLIWQKMFCEQMFVAPILVVNELNESYEIDRQLQKDLVAGINKEKEFKGVEIYKSSNKIITVRSTYDALKVCKEEGIDYLIYGWVKKSEHTYEGEIRLFDGEGRSNIFVIHAKDGIDNYDEFIKNMSVKIVDKIRQMFFIPAEEEIIKNTKINVNCGIGYWTPMNKSWSNYLTGTISLQTGFEVIPSDSVFFIKSTNSYFSVGIALEYLLGASRKGATKGYIHTLNTNLFSNMYFNMYEVHRLFLSFGLLYCMDVVPYKDKYSDKKISVSGASGILLGFGYKYSINNWIRLMLETDVDLVLYDKVFPKFRGKLGVEFEVFVKEYKK